MRKSNLLFLIPLLIISYFFAGNSMYENSSSGNTKNFLRPSTTGSGTFLIGAFNTGWDIDAFVNIDSLGFNVWHSYLVFGEENGRQMPYGGGPDYVNADISSYKTYVRGKLDRATSHNNMTALIMRPKLEWMCFGQRSDYQCEPITKSDDNQWFYSFRDRGVGYPTTDNGATVMRCEVNHSLTDAQNAGWLVKGLMANTEQSNRGAFRGDSLSDWFVKPKIRIDSATAVNFPNKKVCKIVVIAENGVDTLKNINIRAGNFRNAQNPYFSNQYLEEYFFSVDTNLQVHGNWGVNSWYHARGDTIESAAGNHSDIQVYWYGECDMWIDYVRVDDDIANDLFSTDPNNSRHTDYMNWLAWEAHDIATHSAAYRFYLELFEYNNVPCMSYVSRKMDSIMFNTYGKHFSLVCIPIATFYTIHVPEKDKRGVQSLTHFKKFYMDKMGIHEFMFASYPFNTSYIEPESYNTSNTWSRIPNSLLYTTGYGKLAAPVDPGVYDTWLQGHLDSVPYAFEPGGGNVLPEEEPGNFSYTMRRADTLSKMTGATFLFNPQGHIWKKKNGDTPINALTTPRRFPGEVQREPTNEELDLTANIPITYGAKGLIYFEYDTKNDAAYGSTAYDRGISVNNYPRYDNVYGQPKWKKFKEITKRIKKWEPYIMSFDNVNRHSYIYRQQKTAMSQGSFINDIQTADTAGHQDSSANRYIQASVFKNDSADTYYFMIVNRRCSPVRAGFVDGRRDIKIKFNSNYGTDLANFNNWKIIDVEIDTVVATFDKNAGIFVNLDRFNPGQGKLYKVVPVMKTGGTFVGNESIASVQFNFNNPVNTNGKNLTLGGGVNIYFKDSCQLKMNGGIFKCGTYTDDVGNPKSVNLTGQGSAKWRGLSLNNMDTVSVENTLVYNVDSTSSDTKYGVSIINSKVINIDNCNIYNTGSSAGGIFVYYNTYVIMSPTLNLTRNDVRISTANYDGMHIRPYGWLTMTGYIYRNKIINTSTGGGRYGIYGFSLEGTPIKNNYIENFSNGILTWYSSLDVFENTIDTKNISDGWDLYGIVSEYNLSNAYESRLGGSNVLTTLNGRNVCVDALDINIADGNNIFNVNDSAGFHMLGYFPISYPSNVDPPEVYAGGNCFKVEGIEDIKVHCDWLDLRDIQFDFGSSSCAGSPNYCDYYIGGNPNDTVWYECAGGMGGGQKDNYELQITNYKLSAPQENVYKQIYDSLSINMRKKQYELASQKCMTLLDDYTDSAKTINAVDKLYHTALARDKVSELKSYYESFIQSHSNHTHIIQRMFYYIQKAKAKLGQYESAMQGFQTIMNQFPTSYEGLAAKWDYMATQLLDSLNGQGGGEKEAISDEQLTDKQRHERLVSLVEDPLDKYDKKKFTKEDRKVIVNNIVNSFEDKKTKETKRVKELEVKVFMNEATKSEKQEYKTKKVLKEVVRPQTVNTISEHINAVQSDIEKVFSVGKNTKEVDNKTVAVIPLEYKLNQNYPNPFNPSTKINYELKNAGYVSLKIYDLLGREIAELVNETKDAGRYSIDFNASKYMMASGIYFYRIKAGEFVDTKRMVLVK